MINRKHLAIAIGVSLLFVLPALVIRPLTATAAVAPTTGLYGAYWQGSFFGSPAPTWPNCPSASTPVPAAPAGAPSKTAPTAAEIDPNINFGSTTGFYWDESYTSPSTTPPTPGYPGGFAVTNGGYGVAASSWGDKNLYTDYPTSTYFVDTDFSVEWTGYIHLTAGTTYEFNLTSDDGSALYINPTLGSSTISSADIVINAWSTQAPTSTTSSPFSVTTTGNYAIEVDYFETCDTQSGIDLSWGVVSPSGGVTFSIIPTTAFTPAQIGSNAPYLPPTGVPEFGLAAPMVSVVGLLALAFVRKRALGRADTAV
jgi:hypothetical protein